MIDDITRISFPERELRRVPARLVQREAAGSEFEFSTCVRKLLPQHEAGREVV